MLDFLKKEYASSPNKQFATADRAGAAGGMGCQVEPRGALDHGDRAWRQGALQKEGKIDILEVRRIVLANMPDTSGYIGSKAYWMNAVEEMARKK